MYRCSTPSISRTYFGLAFFFSALHCARTRRRLRFGPDPDAFWFWRSEGKDSGAGSHHQPIRSIPPSDFPPTRRKDMERWSWRSFIDRSSKKVPRYVVDRIGVAGEEKFLMQLLSLACIATLRRSDRGTRSRGVTQPTSVKQIITLSFLLPSALSLCSEHGAHFKLGRVWFKELSTMLEYDRGQV